MGILSSNFTPKDKQLLEGQQEGYAALEANSATQVADVKRMMERFGSSNQEYLTKMGEAQLGAQAAAKLRLDARLADAQLRSRIHEQKLAILKKYYQQQKKQEKAAMISAALGAAGSIAPGVVGLMQSAQAAGLSSGARFGSSAGAQLEDLGAMSGAQFGAMP